MAVVSAPPALPDFDFEWLVHEIRYGNVVPIIGSELYTNNGGEPLEAHMAARLRDELRVPLLGTTLRDVAFAFLANRGSPLTLKTKLSRVFQDALAELPVPLTLLAEISDFVFYVTTAPDDAMERALAQRGRTPRTVAYREKATLELPDLKTVTDPIVCHLLGEVRDSFAITDADILEYFHALVNFDQRPKRLFDELKTRNLLFLGCGYPDWLARLFIRVLRDEPFGRRTERGPQQVIADARVASDPNLQLFLRHYELMLYPPGAAPAFVAELHRQWTATRPPEAPAVGASNDPTLIPDRGVFLSFASEDRDAVREIRNALHGAGIDVWFDESQLKPGMDWDRRIREALHRASLFIPFISPNTEAQRENERYFWEEWSLAADRVRRHAPGTTFIIPVALGTEVSPYEAVVPDAFRTPQWQKLQQRTATAEFIELIKTEYRRKQVRPR